MKPDNKHARHAVEFINNLTLVGDYSGQPLKLRPWQERIIRQIFGTRDKEGRLQYRKVMLYIPRGNTKTTISAAILLYSLLGLPRNGQQILSAAASREQAGKIFDTARQMVEQDPYLSRLVEIVPSQKRIVVPHKYSYYAALSAEARTKLGDAPNIVLFDEFQAQPNRKLHDAVTSAFGKRTDYLLIYMMTAGDDPHSIAYEEIQYAKKVAAGIIPDPHYLPILYYANDEDAWDDETVWHRCNPGLSDGIVNIDFLRAECEQAKHIPARRAAFEQFYLNRWVSRSNAWIPDGKWMLNAAPPECHPDTQYFGGLDSASVQDTTALLLYGKNPSGKFDVVPFFWVSEERVRNRTTSDFDYPAWVRASYLRTTPGDATDQEYVVRDILEICKKYEVVKIGVDRYGIQQWLGPKLLGEGLNVGGVGQGYASMSEPLKTLERQILNGLLCHGGHPVLRWHVSNAQLVSDAAGNYKVDKGSSVEKVDGVVALAMAVFCAGTLATETQSVYNRRGIVYV